MLNKIYCAFLWFMGFRQDEKITFMMRRQKQRLGKWWWIMVISTGLVINGGAVWLVLHVLGVC